MKAGPEIFIDDQPDQRLRSIRYLSENEETVGVIFDHNDTGSCEKRLVLWEKVGTYSGILYNCLDEEPLTIENRINCVGCGLSGYIKEGKWIDA